MVPTIAFGLVLAASRIWLAFEVEPEAFSWLHVYVDVAHLFMGGLAVAWWHQERKWQWYLFWFLNVVEVAAAVGSRVL